MTDRLVFLYVVAEASAYFVRDVSLFIVVSVLVIASIIGELFGNGTPLSEIICTYLLAAVVLSIPVSLIWMVVNSLL